MCCEMQIEGMLVSQIASRAYLYRASVSGRDPLAVDESSSLDQVFVVHFCQEVICGTAFRGACSYIESSSRHPHRKVMCSGL